MKRMLSVTLVLVTSIQLIAQSHVVVANLELEKTRNKGLMYKTFEGKTTLSTNTKGVVRINMDTGAGEVKVRPSNSKEMTVKARIVVSASGKNTAYRTLDEYLNLTLSKEGDEIFLTSIFDYDNRGGRETMNFFSTPARKIDLEVFVPKNIDIHLKDRSGELMIRDLKNNLVINDGSGSIVIEDVIGDLRLVDQSGEIDISYLNHETKGDYNIEIIDHSGELSLSNIGGDTKITDYSGGIYVDDLTGNLELDDTSGGISVNRVVGKLDIRDTSGGISATNINGSVEVSDTSGEIYINDVSKDLYVRNDGSGGQTVRNIAGNIRGEVKRWD